MKDSLSEKSKNSAQIEQEIARYVRQIAATPSAEIYVELGELYARQQQWQQAIASYREAIALDPDFAIAHRRLAVVMNKSGDLDQTANHLFKSFQLQPDFVTAQQHYELARILETENKLVRAIACYRAAIESQPDFKQAYEPLAKLLAKQGKDEAALEVYRQGVRHNPQDSYYYYALAEALAEEKKWVRACNNYQQAADLAPSAEIYYHWGLALYQLQEYDRAQSCYRQAIALQADYEPVYYQLGILWQERQQWQQAIIAYSKVISLNPRRADALVNLGRLYLHLKKYDLAIASFRQAFKYIPEASPIEAEALTEYQQAVALHPQATVDLYYQLGKLLRAKSRFPEAISAYCKSIELDPNFKNAYIDLQYTPVAQKQSIQLIEFYRQIVTQHPEITIAWGNLGDALTQQDRVSEAIDCYRTCSYQTAIQTYPYLAKLDWKKQKTTGPDFIIAGASKCGTSSIYYYLSRHPQILLSHTKEIDFYWTNYRRGIDWYLAHFPTITDRADFITGEATPNYLRFPQVAQRIKDTFPQTKIILLLRNPVDRAISWHYHKLNTGLTRESLSTAIATEIARLATVTEAEITNTGFYNPDNIMSSLYIYKIKSWIELLGRDRFLILKSEDFYLDPLQQMEQVFEFLNLPNCPLENYPKVNAGSYKRVDPELRKTLSEYFTPYNRQLEEYLNLEFNWE